MRIEFIRFVAPVVLEGRTHTFLTDKMYAMELTESFLIEISDRLEALIAIVPLHNVVFLRPALADENLENAELSIPSGDNFSDANEALFVKRGPGRPRNPVKEANGRVSA